MDIARAISRKKIIVISAAEIDSRSRDSISQVLSEVYQGADNFSLQVIRLSENLSGVSEGLQQSLDNTNQGNADIYDYTSLLVSDFLSFFVTPIVLAKLFFSENKALDGIRGSKKTFYNKGECQGFNPPELEEVIKTLFPAASTITDIDTIKTVEG